MPETAESLTTPLFAGSPPGNQSSFLQALLGKKVYVRLRGEEVAPLFGTLRGWDATTFTLEVGSETTFPMLVFKHAVATLYPG